MACHHQNRSEEEKLISEYYGLTLDISNPVYFPQFIDKDGEIELIGTYEQITFLYNPDGYDQRENEYETAKAYFEEFIHPMEALCKKYFAIFTRPPYFNPENSQNYAQFNVIYAPTGFKSEYNQLIHDYHLEDFYHLFLHLIAHILEYYSVNYYLFTKPGMIYYKEEQKDVENFRKLLKLLSSSNSNKKLTKVSFHFNDETVISFDKYYVLQNNIIRRIRHHNTAIGYFPPPYINDPEIPFKNDYRSFFITKIIMSLNNFLTNETDLKPEGNHKTSSKQIEFIARFIFLSGLNGSNNFPIDTIELEKFVAIVKKRIIEKIKKEEEISE